LARYLAFFFTLLELAGGRMLIVEKHIVLQPAGGHPRDFGNPRSRYFFLLKPIDQFFCFF
jgi:hypothetical protein